MDAKLQKAYYPIFEILHKAKMRTKESGITILQSLEKRNIENIITRYGYYLDSRLLGLIKERIIDTPNGTTPYQETEIGEIYETLLKKTKNLKNNLRN